MLLIDIDLILDKIATSYLLFVDKEMTMLSILSYP